MEDYHSWLDNIAAADMRASKYFVDKVTPSFSSNSSQRESFEEEICVSL